MERAKTPRHFRDPRGSCISTGKNASLQSVIHKFPNDSIVYIAARYCLGCGAPAAQLHRLRPSGMNSTAQTVDAFGRSSRDWRWQASGLCMSSHAPGPATTPGRRCRLPESRPIPSETQHLCIIHNIQQRSQRAPVESPV